MAWIKLDVNFLENPKVDALSSDAKLLCLWGLLYAGRQLTDGFIPKRRVASAEQQKLVKELVECELWHEANRGYEIHDYLKYQTPKERVEEVKGLNRERARKYRSKKGVMRDVTRDSRDHITNLEVEVEIEEELDIEIAESFMEFWAIYPRQENRIDALLAYLKAIERTDPQVILDGAKRYASDTTREYKYTVLAHKWLAKARWTDSLPPTPTQSSEGRTAPTRAPAKYVEPVRVPLTDEQKANIKKIQEGLREVLKSRI